MVVQHAETNAGGRTVLEDDDDDDTTRNTNDRTEQQVEQSGRFEDGREKGSGGARRRLMPEAWKLESLRPDEDADDREQKRATTTKFTFLSCRYMGQMDRSGNERRKGACERLCVCVTTPGAGDGDSDDEGV